MGGFRETEYAFQVTGVVCWLEESRDGGGVGDQAVVRDWVGAGKGP